MHFLSGLDFIHFDLSICPPLTHSLTHPPISTDSHRSIVSFAMELTRTNFTEALPALIQSINDGATRFVAIDLEFSGLNNPGGRPSVLDLVEQRYEAAVGATGEFFPLQIGFSVFSENPKSQFTADTYTVYTCPREDDRVYSLQPSSVEFLTRNNFEFGKSFNHGVGWLTREEEKRRSERLDGESKKDGEERDKVIVTQERDKLFVANLETLAKNMTMSDDLVASELIDEAFKCKEEHFQGWIVLRSMNRFLKRVAYETLEAFPAIAVGQSNERLVLKRMASAESVSEFKLKLEADKRTALRERCGVRLILDAIRDARIPVVTHNGLLDILHLMHCSTNQIRGASLDEFKKLVVEAFPGGLIDTKWIAKNSFFAEKAKEINGTSLEELARDLPSVNIEIKGGGENVEKFHDAGFDAFTTGSVLLQLSNFAEFESSFESFNSLWMLPLNASDDSINLNGVDLVKARSNIIVASDFPKEFRQSHISKALNPTKIQRFIWVL